MERRKYKCYCDEDEIMERFKSYSREYQVRILYRAMDYLEKDRRRDKIESIALSMGFKWYPGINSRIYYKEI